MKSFVNHKNPLHNFPVRGSWLVIEPWVIITAISLAFGIPVLLSSYYTIILFVSSLRYPSTLGVIAPATGNFPHVSVRIASYKEKFVIGRTLDAIKYLDYLDGKIQVVVADDSTDESRSLIDKKIRN